MKGRAKKVASTPSGTSRRLNPLSTQLGESGATTTRLSTTGAGDGAKSYQTEANFRDVQFEITAEPGSQVYVAGSFNGWNPTADRLTDNPDNGYFKTTIKLPKGTHEYKFVVNGVWCVDPQCPEWTPNDQGSLNSVLRV